MILADSKKMDFIAWICSWMAHYPFENSKCFLVGQTFCWGKPITTGSDMCEFYFASPPFIDLESLAQRRVTAESFIHLIPISRAEINFKLEYGLYELLRLFGRNKFEPVFDLNRKCLMITC